MNRTVPMVVDPINQTNGTGAIGTPSAPNNDSKVAEFVPTVHIPSQYLRKFAKVVPEVPKALSELCASKGISIRSMEEHEVDTVLAKLMVALSICEVSFLKNEICIVCKYVAPSGKTKGLSTSGSRKDLVPRILAWMKCYIMLLSGPNAQRAGNQANTQCGESQRSVQRDGKQGNVQHDEKHFRESRGTERNAEQEDAVERAPKKARTNSAVIKSPSRRVRVLHDKDLELRAKELEMEKERHAMAMEKGRIEIQKMKISGVAEKLRVQNELFTSLISVEKTLQEAGDQASPWLRRHKAELEREMGRLNKMTGENY